MTLSVDSIKPVAALAVASAMCLFGSLPLAMQTLLLLMVLDVATGVGKALVLGQADSRVGARGLGKKVVTLSIVATAHLIGQMLGDTHLTGTVVAGCYCGVEGLSILENAGQAGVWVPPFLRDGLSRLRDLSTNPSLLLKPRPTVDPSIELADTPEVEAAVRRFVERKIREAADAQ